MRIVAILLVAFCVGWWIGTWVAGPLPQITRMPIEAERNYTLETLRTLNPPPPPTYQQPRPMGGYGDSYMGHVLSSHSFINTRPND